MARRRFRTEDEEEGLTEEEKIIQEAKERFARCETWEAHARTLADDDWRFVNGDSDNLYQWPDKIANTREINAKPCLTINKVRQHCLMIENDAKQNKPGIIIHPTTNEATYDAAQVFEDIIRHIESRSHAQNAYDAATVWQVRTGYGVLRVATEYADSRSFDQEIRIKSVKDPNTVYFDPDAKEPDKSDSKFAFVFDDMDRKVFEAKYPDVDANIVVGPEINYNGWMGENHVRVAEYWKLSTKPDKVCSWVDPDTGDRVSVLKSDVTNELWKRFTSEKDDPSYKERAVESDVIQCYKIAGDKIIPAEDGKLCTEWAGRYIPLVPVIGEEIVVNGQMDRRGHVRMLKDPQRQYNYYSSAAVEVVALQTKTPYVGPSAAFEGFEQEWSQANQENLAYLPYNHRDQTGGEIPAPQRQAGPQMSEAMLQGMQVAQTELMMASGQYQAQMGENENAKSGVAISERQRQGDTATYHFIDNLSISIRHLGRILIDLIPKIYDTKRILRIRGQDGTQRMVTIDPSQPQAVQKQAQTAQNGQQQVQLIFNPNVGEYDVEADVGPSFSTRRQETFNALTQLLAKDPNLQSILGDLYFQNADFAGADEMAKRMRKIMNPAIFDEGASPAMQQMQQQFQTEMQRMNATVGELMTKLAEQNLKLKGKDAQKDIDVYDAETRRITAISNAQPELGLETIKPVVQQTLSEMLGFDLKPVADAMKPTLSADAAQSSVDNQQQTQQPPAGVQ